MLPDGGEVLTLVTCYPFNFVGPAPERYIVRAKRMPASEERMPAIEPGLDSLHQQ